MSRVSSASHPSYTGNQHVVVAGPDAWSRLPHAFDELLDPVA
ncbi:hypothetical protein [Streptomyces sp. OE57]